MLTKEEIEGYATIMAQPGFDLKRDAGALLGDHVYGVDLMKVMARTAEIAREIAEAALDEADRLNEEVRADMWPDTPTKGP